MRVTASTFYKDYAKSVQDLKSIYNKSMQQVSSGKKYENAYENPLDYYAGKKIDNLYNDVVTKDTMIKDVINRLEQQETTSRTFHSQMSDLNIKYEQMASASYQGSVETVDTMYTYVLNKQQTLTQDLNATYENYYVMGGNDQTTIPFSMSADGMELTYHHKFPGDSNVTTMTMTYDPENKCYNYSGTYVDENGNTQEFLKRDADGNLIFDEDGNTINDEDAVLDKILQAMREQGRMSLGYGDITNLETLPDTYYGGLNMVTGLTSEKLRAMDNDSAAKQVIQSAMNTSAFGLNSQVIDSAEKYRDSFYATTVTERTFTIDIDHETLGGVASFPPSTPQEFVSSFNARTDWPDTAYYDEASGVLTFTSKTNGAEYPSPFSQLTIDQLGLTFTPGTDTTPSYYTSMPLTSMPVTEHIEERSMTAEEKEAAKETARQKLNEDLSYTLGNWGNSMISVSNTFRRIGVATATLEEVDNQLQTSQDTYIKEYNDHMAIDTYDAIVQMYQHMYSYNAAMQVGSKIMQNSLFDFVK